MSEKVLVVEDELALRETLAYNLDRQGYQVETAGDGQAAIDAARRFKPDLIVLDLMLPVLDGFEVCRVLRQEMTVPIIMLTARDEEIDRVLGLELGADDYITKPFSMREFIARVKAHLRRIRLIHAEISSDIPATSEQIRIGDLTLDLTRREALLNQKALMLKPKEFDLLFFLVRNRGHVLTREYILEKVWGWDYSGGSRTVDVHIRWLREKIESDPNSPSRIITVRGSGYRYEG
ncbi:MAG: response regulator transcription factor [Anaerolineales bacterium]|nr:response regulator transcription factor [Anaerolineales bacterium]